MNSVGIDATNFMTREFTTEMKDLSSHLFQMLTYLPEQFNIHNVDTSKPFNHCTILLYYASDIKNHTLLRHHCDCTYSNHNGKYIPSANSQCENTATVIYSLAGTRFLHWKRRMLSKVSKGWCDDDNWEHTFELCRDSVCIIHPDDENPLSSKNIDKMYQYQHGVQKVTGDNFSAALVFRVVNSIQSYDVQSNLMIPEQQVSRNEMDQRTYDDFNANSDDFHHKLLKLYNCNI